MAKPAKYPFLHKKLMTQTNRLFESKDGNELLTALSNGQNTYLRFDRFESSSMDMTWIKKIEEILPDLNDIVSNPRKTIQTLSEVVEVEKAKKTSSESVQHLASHTQFVKSIDEEGNITPSKILNIYNDDFYAIYENKFIATLIRRLFLFVEKRYQYILNKAKLEDVELLYFKNKTNFQGSEIVIETKVSYSRPAAESTAEKMTEMLKRIGDIRSYLRFFTNSEFMKILHRERDVKNPILQTNIIRKNPKYRNCYHLWQFLNSYMEAGVDFRVEELYPKLTQEDLTEINKMMVMNFLALKGRDSPRKDVKVKQYRPRILKTYDDEMFNPGPKFEGPIEFIRVDNKYRQFAETLKDLDPHPTKAMKEYMKEDYDGNKKRKKTTEQVDALLKRKEHEYEKYQKEQEKLIVKEQEDEEMISDLAEQRVIEEQEEKLQPYRDALAHKGHEKPVKVKKPEPEPEIVEEEEEKELYIPEDVQSLLEPTPEEIQEAEQPKEEAPVEEQPVEEPVKQVEEPVQEEEQPAEEPVKKKRGGARPGAGRPRKVVEEQPEPEAESEPQPEPEQEPEPVVEEPVPEEEPVEEQPVKKQRGGARPGAGRPRKVVEAEPIQEPEPVQEEPQPEPQEEPQKKQRGGARPGAGRPKKAVGEPEEEPAKKARGGARPGAGRKPKPKEEPKPEPVKEEPKVVEPPKPVEQPKPVVQPAPKPMSKKEKRLARKAEREEKQAKILKVSSSRAGKKFGRRK